MSSEAKKNKEEDVPVVGADYGIESLIAHWKRRRGLRVVVNEMVGVSDRGSVHVISPPGIPSEEAVGEPTVSPSPEVLLQAAIVVFGDKTNEGQLIQAVTIPWFEIIREIERDPAFLHKFDWRKLEELVAGAYERAGWPVVVLTPRSGDRGRDIIATKPGVGSIRILDQVKAYAPHRKVTAGEVRDLLGVLDVEQNVSKGIVTTTSQFAPGLLRDERLKAFMPYRLELKDGKALREWLIGVAAGRK